MPIYEYRPTTEKSCDRCRNGFEQLQKLADPRLSACPDCQSPVQRVLSAPSLTKPGPSLLAANLEQHGFTQYKKSGKGVYQKTAGSGPDVISDS